MPSRMPLRPLAPPFPSQRPFETALDEAQPPAFASAADALRAKIRACAARSFAAQHKRAAQTIGSREDSGEKFRTAMAAGRGARKLGQDGPRVHS
jgi:hypothetical protein